MLTPDEKFMRVALNLAKKGLGRTSPNPAVGAVIVRAGRVIAAGYHKKAGEPHAEVEALKAMSGKVLKNDTLYVTLEPCNHFGKTQPCTQAILQAGIKKLVIGMRDPNPRVKGGGIAFLKSKGVNVKVGVLEAECRRLNEAFVKFITTGRPFVMAKSALTLDGWSAAANGDSQWVSNELSRGFAHGLRDQADAIMVGVGTVLKDDPALTTRLARKKGRDPIRIILDTQFRIPETAKVLNPDSSAKTIVVIGDQTVINKVKIEALAKLNAEVLICPQKTGHLDLAALMPLLGQKSITSILLEGGAAVMGNMIRKQLVDKFYIFKAPKLLSGNDGIPMAYGFGAKQMDQALPLKDIQIKRFQDDILVTAYPIYPEIR
jgi:diaminohydroxyphosphoribosylaminopyrimidine deaminase/5-amino-6-(5-phosphoribosylamino)uracil reductase